MATITLEQATRPRAILGSRRSLRGLRGLRDEFNPSIQYNFSTTSTPVSDATLSLMLNQHRVGTYTGYPVLQDPATAKLYVFKNDEKLYQMIEAAAPQPTVVDSSCPPCAANCQEITQQVTYWASPDKKSETDIAIPMVQDVIVCPPITEKPVPACADALAKLKASGMSGLGEINREEYKKCTKWCNDTTHGEDLIKCYKKCDGVVNTNGGRLVSFPTGGYATAYRNTAGAFYEPIPQTLRGLSNDASTTVTDPVQYTTDPYLQTYLPTSIAKCDRSNDVLYWILFFLGGIFGGVLLNMAWKKR